MKNNQYWINRISDSFLDTEKTAKKLARETEKHYNKALKNINNEIARLYARFENDNQIKLDEALKILNINEMQEWKMTLKEYLKQIEKTGDENLLLELNTLAMQSRITRLEALKQVINAETEILRYNLDTEVGKNLSKVVRDTHKNTLYGFFEQDLINKRDLVDISNEDIQDILKLKWYSGNYSSRIWNNTKKLAEFSKNSVISALGSGRSYDNIIKDLKGEFEQNRRYELERVVRTESAFVHTQAEKKAFENAEIEEYKISAHLDIRTSEICTSENGNVYKLDELKVGYNAPPFHPNCRSIIVPVTEFDDDKNISSGYSDKIYPISDDTIENLKTPYIDSLSDEENKKLNEYHKTLLKEARDKNESKEVAYKFNGFDDKLEIIYGTRTDLDLGYKESKFVLHNHPNNEFFSNQDIIYFVTHKVEYMSIVKHNGEVSIIVKNQKFDNKDISLVYSRLMKKYKNLIDQNIFLGYNKLIEKLITKYDGIDLY